jgi:hypothetical protein
MRGIKGMIWESSVLDADEVKEKLTAGNSISRFNYSRMSKVIA